MTILAGIRIVSQSRIGRQLLGSLAGRPPVELRINGNSSAVLHDIGRVVPELARGAAVMALNKANQRVGTEFRRRLAAATGIRQKTLRQTIRQYKAGRGRMLARTWMGLDRRIPMSEVLKGKGTAIPDIYAQLLEQGPTGSKPFKLGNRRGLYVRHGRKRLPVRQLKLTLQEVAPPILREVGDSIAAAEFQREFSRQLRRALARPSRTRMTSRRAGNPRRR